MESLEEIKSRIKAAVVGAKVKIIPNASPVEGKIDSLLIDREHGRAVAEFLRDDPKLAFDYLSNATGVDWLDTVKKEKVTTKKVVDGEEKEVTETVEENIPGYLEAVYHLYSMSLKHGPLTIRFRTGNRTDEVHLPALTPVWRSAEFQEREIFDLYGIVFDGHPDLRRLLMWDEFEDHPMRKDYVDTDDFEYEPTPHGDVLEKAKLHYPGAKANSCDSLENQPST